MHGSPLAHRQTLWRRDYLPVREPVKRGRGPIETTDGRTVPGRAGPGG